MCRPRRWVVVSIAFMFLFAHRLPRDAGTSAEIGVPVLAESPQAVTQNLLLAVRTTEWQTVDTGLLEVSALAPPRSAGSFMIDDTSLAEAMSDPQAFAYLPAGGTTSVSPSSR
jgi:hypothetical protein